MKNILVPIATREKGINNLTYAVNFASITQARVYVVSINSDGGAESVLRDVLDAVPTMKNVQVVSKILSGDIFDGIQELSRSLKIDLMILSPKSIDISEKLYLGKLINTNNATVFQGVLEHYQSINPDLICLLRRRKQNMFEKIWQHDEVYKEEFYSTKPLLILKERE